MNTVLIITKLKILVALSCAPFGASENLETHSVYCDDQNIYGAGQKDCKTETDLDYAERKFRESKKYLDRIKNEKTCEKTFKELKVLLR